MPLPAVFWAGKTIIAAKALAALFLRPALPYTNITQVHHKWCWAAVAQGIEAYYAGHPFPSPYPDQCVIATRALVMDGKIGGIINCCNANDAAQHCNIEYQLEPALQVVRHDAGPPFPVQRVRPWPTGTLDREIRNGRVFAVRVVLGAGGSTCGHFLVVHGYQVDSIGVEFVDVADPEIPQMTRNLITLWSLANAYRVIGTWDYVYPTQP